MIRPIENNFQFVQLIGTSKKLKGIIPKNLWDLIDLLYGH